MISFSGTEKTTELQGLSRPREFHPQPIREPGIMEKAEQRRARLTLTETKTERHNTY